MVQQTSVPLRLSIWSFESTVLGEFCKTDGLDYQALTEVSAHHSGSTASICKWCDQPHWLEVSGNVHPLIQTKWDFSNAADGLGKGVESESHYGEPFIGCPVLKGYNEKVGTDYDKLNDGPNATIKNSRRWQTMPPLPNSTVSYSQMPDIMVSSFIKGVSGLCQHCKKFLQDGLLPRHRETSELWKPSTTPASSDPRPGTFLLTAPAPSQTSLDYSSQRCLRAFSFYPFLQAKLSHVSSASQNGLLYDVLLCVLASPVSCCPMPTWVYCFLEPTGMRPLFLHWGCLTVFFKTYFCKQ